MVNRRPDGYQILRITCAAIPFLGLIVAVPWVNRIHPIIFGIPFFFFWITLFVLLVPLCMLPIYYFDPERRARRRE